MRYLLPSSKFSAKHFLAISIVIATIILIGAWVKFGFTPSQALSARDFNYGNIIDDAVFYDKDSMNVNQIQDFLNRLNPNCDTWGTQPSEYGGGTRAQYAAARGWHGPPYACLKNYHENPNNSETSFERGGGSFAGGISAAQIIYNAAQQYGISPRVILVLLKKESAGPLTADTWPLKSQYRYAMGYACPDSGPGFSANCSNEKSGFYKQVMLAAWQLKYYREHPNDYRYKIGLNTIQYAPDPACGTRQVTIENIATLSLYIYTPYVPNDGALNNYPGTAHCGAYGNRNFFMFYNEWFGSTRSNQQVDILKADQDIIALHNQSQSHLGSAIGARTAEFKGKTRVWQNFQRGTVVWTPDYGAYYILNGSIYDRWRTIGGSLGTLGVPIRNPATEQDGRVWQSFEKGMVVYSQTTGAWEILPGPLGDKWRTSGGSTGTLGRPTSGVDIGSNGLRKQSFENGAVVRKDISAPAYVVAGNIYSIWSDKESTLRAPLMDQKIEPSDGRIWQNFEKGVVIESSVGQTASVQFGDVYNLWKQIGGSTGKLGKPISSQTTESDGRIWQNFEKGVVIKKNNSSAAREIIYGPLYDRWRTLGGSTGELGVPTNSTTTESDGRVWQNFEKGTLIWSTTTGAWEIQGGFYDFWRQKGGSTGTLGKPVSSRTIEANDTRWQEFENARITWQKTSGWTVTSN